MSEHRYYTVQHRNEIGTSVYWFDANPRYYGIGKDNYFTSVDEAKALLEIIKGKADPHEEFRVVYHVNTEEVVA